MITVHPDPFPHAVEDGLWDNADLYAAMNAFPPPQHPIWRRFANDREVKFGSTGPTTSLPMPVQRVLAKLHDPEWCGLLGMAFNIPGLTADIWGGGMHMIPPGGKLDMHVDFNQHHNGLYRRINCLVYLNLGWKPEHGGQLYLGAEREVTVEPVFNRTAMFATSDTSWHGHPEPTSEGFWRKSLAVYYYSPEPAPTFDQPHDTIFLGV
jgi:hypothetical protein